MESVTRSHASEGTMLILKAIEDGNLGNQTLKASIKIKKMYGFH